MTLGRISWAFVRSKEQSGQLDQSCIASCDPEDEHIQRTLGELTMAHLENDTICGADVGHIASAKSLPTSLSWDTTLAVPAPKARSSQLLPRLRSEIERGARPPR